MGSTRKRLTDARIRSLAKMDVRYEEWDTEPGFGLRIAPSGRKSFIYLYRFEGKPRRMTLGVFPRVSLADAREVVGKAIKKLDKGIDPGAEIIAAKKSLRDAESFAELVHEWIERWAKPNRKTWREAQRQLEVDAVPAWGKRKANSITRRDVMLLIDSIMDRGAPVTANRTLSLIKQIFKFGVQRDILETSPAVDVDKPAKERRRDRVLSEDEIRSFWFGLDNAVMGEDVRIALKLCLVTAQRRAEVAALSRSEIDGDWWALPKERTKNGKPHRTFLSPLAKKLIQEASGEDHIFPSPRNDGPIKASTLIVGIARHRDKFEIPRFTVHDLRRTAATRMAELGVPRIDISKVLNHTDQDVTAIYDLHNYDKEKKRAMLKWGRRLQSIIEGQSTEQVVRIGG